MTSNNAIHYTAVLADLKAERKELDNLIAMFERRLALQQESAPTTKEKELELTITYDYETPLVQAKANNPANEEAKPKVSVLDTAYDIISRAKIPVHGKEILRQLHLAGHTQTTAKSISGNMPQDSKKRFENLGRNTWALTEWEDSFKTYHRNKLNPPEASQTSLLDEN